MLVAIARGKHLFPFRTEQLSPSALMVLSQDGRVSRRQLNTIRACSVMDKLFFCVEFLPKHFCIYNYAKIVNLLYFSTIIDSQQSYVI